MAKDKFSFSAESKGILEVHLTANGLSVDPIQCKWIVRDVGPIAGVGRLPDGMILVVDKDGDSAHLEFHENLEAFFDSHGYFNGLMLEVCHRLKIKKWKGHDVEIWFRDAPEFAVA